MSKAIMTTTLAAILTAAILFSGCSSDDTGGGSRGGEVITEDKYFTDFTYIEVEGTFEVEITQSDSYSITVSAEESLFEYVAVAKEDDTLRIYLDPRHTFSDFTVTAKTLKAEITMPNVSGIYLSGAVKGTVSGFKSSDDFHVVVSGASSLVMTDIETGDVKSEVSGASNINGNIKADDAEFEVSGASNIELSGSADNIVLSISGASKIVLADLPLNNADVSLSGASEATIHVKGRLDTVLSGASRLYFIGNPAMGKVSISGASTIKHE